MNTSRFWILSAVLCAVGACLSAGAAVVLTKAAVFPLVDLEVLGMEEFNAAPNRSPISYETLRMDRDFRWDGPERITAAIRDMMHHGDGGALVSPEHAAGAKGLCSEYSKAAVSLAAGERIGRVVWLSEHTVSEFWNPNRAAWELIDTNGNSMFQDPRSGNLLGVADLIAGRDAEPVKIIPEPEVSDDPAFLPERLEVFRNTKVCVVIEGPRLYDFHLRNRRAPIAVGFLFLGAEPAAHGIALKLPGSFEPALAPLNWIRMLLYTSLLFGVCSVGLLWKGLKNRTSGANN